MKLKNKISLLSFGLTAVMLLIGNGQAVAEDGKTYPASFCTPNRNYSNHSYSVKAGVWTNEKGPALDLECPIIKDSINKGLRNGFVRVIDQSSGWRYDVVCTITSRRTHVYPHQGFTTRVASKGASSSVQTLHFASLGHDRKNTTYIMNCRIPGVTYKPGRTVKNPPSKILGYYISENT